MKPNIDENKSNAKKNFNLKLFRTRKNHPKPEYNGKIVHFFFLPLKVINAKTVVRNGEFIKTPY